MFKVLFPSLAHGRSSTSYELGVAILLLWVGETLHRAGDVATRYPSRYWIWTWLDKSEVDQLIPWYCLFASGMICAGLLRLACRWGNGHLLRAAGLGMASILFLFIAVGHISVTFYTVGGAPYLFLAWRFLELAAFYARRDQWR